MNNTIRDLAAAGVAVWLDDLSRDRLDSGSLADLVSDRGVVGVTTNPTIFAAALSKGHAYDAQIADLAVRGVDLEEAVRSITTADVRRGCDVLRPVHDATSGIDGRVSIEVDPRIAHDTKRTVAEATALWWLVDRPNLFIKIPATKEGLSSIEATLVTLIFSLQRYDDVMAAFLSGLEHAKKAGHDLSRLTSVASFFVSRVDTEVDKRLDKLGTDDAAALRGSAAIANARLAYQHYEKVFGSARWRRLADAGATPQRPLWASTGVKDPAYDDTRYVIDLVAPGIVNTMPEATLDAVADHGVFRGDTVRNSYAEAKSALDSLAAVGVDYDDVVETLEAEGVAKFEDSWTTLLDTVQKELDGGAKAAK